MEVSAMLRTRRWLQVVSEIRSHRSQEHTETDSQEVRFFASLSLPGEVLLEPDLFSPLAVMFPRGHAIPRPDGYLNISSDGTRNNDTFRGRSIISGNTYPDSVGASWPSRILSRLSPRRFDLTCATWKLQTLSRPEVSSFCHFYRS